jgi:DNA-binding HxlR family transcriptional regulator/putative sterol carrier protein
VEPRTYNQYCAAARTLDIVGERWTLLLVRELLTGPKRFVDLRRSLRGIGTGLLTARLKHLEDEGLTRKVTLPAPAGTPAYVLTEAGAELEPAVLALARWGMSWAMGERREGETHVPGWAVLGMRVTFDAEAAGGLRAVYEFRIDDEVFHARVGDGTIETAYGPTERPDAVIECDDEVFLGVTTGRLSLTEAIMDGTAKASGDRQALRRLHTLFRWPHMKVRPAAIGAP